MNLYKLKSNCIVQIFGYIFVSEATLLSTDIPLSPEKMKSACDSEKIGVWDDFLHVKIATINCKTGPF